MKPRMAVMTAMVSHEKALRITPIAMCARLRSAIRFQVR